MADDKVWYLRHEHFEFDPIASFPNKESDMVTIVNVPYNVSITLYLVTPKLKVEKVEGVEGDMLIKHLIH